MAISLHLSHSSHAFISTSSNSPKLTPIIRCSSSSSNNNNNMPIKINGHRLEALHSKENDKKILHEFSSKLVETLRDNGNEYTWGNVTVVLAEAHGLCWGDERALHSAFEARRQFPDAVIWLLHDIVAHPAVAKSLRNMNIKSIPAVEGMKQLDVVSEGDIVILPAYGASLDELNALNLKNAQLIKTTCPLVSQVLDTVKDHKKRDYTSIIHGQAPHQETISTASFASKYIIVNNMAEAKNVCDYILGGELNGSSSTKDQFLKHFKFKVSKGFDPDIDLLKVGIANQTTMLKGETLEIGKMVERTMKRKFGAKNIDGHFLSFNLVCDATQRRYNAMHKLVEKDLDFILVVGEWNSYSSSRLQEIAELEGVPSYWVDSDQRIGPKNTVQFKLNYGGLTEKKRCIPKGPIKIGVMADISAPDAVTEKVLLKVFEMNLKETMWFA